MDRFLTKSKAKRSSSSTSSGSTSKKMQSFNAASFLNNIKNSIKRRIVLPSTNGMDFKIFPASALNSNGKRSVLKKYDQLTQKNTMQIRNKIDLFQYAKSCMKGTSWDQQSALEAETVALSLFPFFYVCMPIVHCRQTLLDFPATQVKVGNEIVGVRDMCDVCFSNEYVAYEALRVRGPVHDFENKAFAIDIKCTCTNPKCPALIKEAEKKAKSTGLSITDVMKIDYLKKNNIRYIFSNVSEELLRKYPRSINAAYQLHDRPRGMLTLRLRRALFVNEPEANIHERIVQRYREYWMSNGLRVYLDIVRGASKSDRLLFNSPTNDPPIVQRPISVTTMTSIMDKFWEQQDRTAVIAHIQSNVPKTQISADFTFEAARLAEAATRIFSAFDPENTDAMSLAELLRVT